MIYSISFVICISRWKMASTVNSEWYNGTLQIAKSENKVGRLQLDSIAGCKTKSFEVFTSVMLAWFQLLPFYIFNIYTEVSFYDICLFNSLWEYRTTTTRNKRKCRIGSNLHQANITLNISTNFVLQPAIEANCKRPSVFSDFAIYSTAKYNLLFTAEAIFQISKGIE
jgi:hypothetical protein